MKNLIYKEFRLAMHPAALIFIFLSAMMLIPNYPLYVTFFYTSLGIFFICLTGRENYDIYYTSMLPVRRCDIVYARMLTALILETAQLVLAATFAHLRAKLGVGVNLVGMDANTAFFGSAAIMLGIFNFVFFTAYYKNPDKVGKAFVLGSIAEGIYMLIADTLVHVLPFARDVLDTPDPDNLLSKLAVLVIGVLIFAILTFAAMKKAVRSFSRLDL